MYGSSRSAVAAWNYSHHCLLEHTSIQTHFVLNRTIKLKTALLPTEDQITKLMDMLKILAKKQSSGELQDEIENLNEEKENSMAYCQFKNDNILEKILNNPGFRHLAENIFDNLNFEDLVVCQEINQSSKEILEYLMDKPIFLLTKFRNLSKENEKDWINVIQSTKSPKKEKTISAYLKWNLKKEAYTLFFL